ncbi:glycosyltransferase family 4 protein [Enterococcus dongliensis]|uniref:glycosyltransferase family 4 protein n=1 Tax=Enterococcus dongliensis TaxID=2559925 RepID=UPI00288FECBC|nr:glycosyltransferase family 4 protein [Enterococcus dongliensis]MDT2646100.1 glycosyltransferase family 4 protein [Enterococcus dongliensis]
MSRIVILANNDAGLYKFRKEIIAELLKRYEVFVILPYGNYVQELVDMGCNYFDISLSRRGVNPFKDLILLKKYIKLIKKIRPNYVLTYTIKPNVYGGIACRLLKVKYLVNITGLGSSFEKQNIVSKIVMKLYSIALKHAYTVFFQNNENKILLNSLMDISKNQVLLPGSGINLKEYPFFEYQSDLNVVNYLYVGRLMVDKGIDELLNSFFLLNEKYPNTTLTIVGPIEEGYDTTALDKMINQEKIRYVGLQSDPREFIKKCHVLVNPSHHEGMSNVLLEASASGRPGIASDIPGCREIIKHQETGLLFETKNVASLYNALESFYKLDFQKKSLMGKSARNFVEHFFSRDIVIKKYLEQLEGEKS